MENDLNQKIKTIYIEWLKSKKCFIPVSSYKHGEIRWKIFDYNLAKNRNKSLNSISNSLGISPSDSFYYDFNRVDFFGNVKDWMRLGCLFDEDTEREIFKELFTHIYDGLNNEEKTVFLSMCTRLFKPRNFINFAKDNKELFKSWVNVKPANFAGMMSHEEMASFFTVFEFIYSKDINKENILYKYLDIRRKKMLKRVETQQILKIYINSFIQDKNRFYQFLDKVNNNDFFKSTGKVISFNVNKLGFYNNLNSSGRPIDKFKLTEFLLSFMVYINQSVEEKKRLFLNQFVMLNKGSEFDYYTVIFDSNEDNPLINYLDLFQEVMISCSDLICNTTIQHKGFSAAITKYFIELNLPKKSFIEKPEKKTKL